MTTTGARAPRVRTERWSRRSSSRPLLLLPWLLVVVVVAVVACLSPGSRSLLLRASAAPTAPSVSGSVNTVYLGLFQQALLAYQLQVPEFTGVTITSHSGLAAGLAAAQSGAFDFVVGSSSAPDSMRTTSPTMESYPIAVAGVAPFYNLPAEVGTDVLTLTNEAMCRMWRGDITHWSAEKG